MAQDMATVLDQAANILARDGAWTQGHYYRKADGETTNSVAEAECFCVLGAIRKAGHYDQSRDFDYNPAAKFLERLLGTPHGCHGWNDDPERTQAEVVAKLREAAALAREQEDGR